MLRRLVRPFIVMIVACFLCNKVRHIGLATCHELWLTCVYTSWKSCPKGMCRLLELLSLLLLLLLSLGNAEEGSDDCFSGFLPGSTYQYHHVSNMDVSSPMMFPKRDAPTELEPHVQLIKSRLKPGGMFRLSFRCNYLGQRNYSPFRHGFCWTRLYSGYYLHSFWSCWNQVLSVGNNLLEICGRCVVYHKGLKCSYCRHWTANSHLPPKESILFLSELRSTDPGLVSLWRYKKGVSK